jgi:predicted HTH domain antitoxin
MSAIESLTMPTMTPEQVLDLARQLSPVEQRWLALHLQEHLETTLPERATLDEAVELYLADACSLGRAAELAGVTRWDVLDALKARGEMQRPADVRSADEMDELAERLVQPFYDRGQRYEYPQLACSSTLACAAATTFYALDHLHSPCGA